MDFGYLFVPLNANVAQTEMTVVVEVVVIIIIIVIIS